MMAHGNVEVISWSEGGSSDIEFRSSDLNIIYVEKLSNRQELSWE